MGELFVYSTMRLDNVKQTAPRILLLADGHMARSDVGNSWLRFDTLKCECFDPADKVRILRVIDRYPGGARGFNGCIRSLARTLLGELCEAAEVATEPLVDASQRTQGGVHAMLEDDSMGDRCFLV